jgi:hypothetical protein
MAARFILGAKATKRKVVWVIRDRPNEDTESA